MSVVSAKQRGDAEKLRLKYARTFKLPTDKVHIAYLENEDAKVYSSEVPVVWTLGLHPAEEVWE